MKSGPRLCRSVSCVVESEEVGVWEWAGGRREVAVKMGREDFSKSDFSCDADAQYMSNCKTIMKIIAESSGDCDQISDEGFEKAYMKFLETHGMDPRKSWAPKTLYKRHHNREKAEGRGKKKKKRAQPRGKGPGR